MAPVLVEGQRELVDLPSPPHAQSVKALARLRSRRTGRRGMVLRLVAAALVLLGLGNLAILGLTTGARVFAPQNEISAPGAGNLFAVDAEVLRGANPTHEGLISLRDMGVTTVVDLRAEVGSGVDDSFIESLGMTVVHLPIRDGQTPSDEQMVAFHEIVRNDPGLVFVHCGAGVGRTGVVAARYLVETDQTDELTAWTRNLAIGPPSIEQDAYALGLDLHGVNEVAMVSVSRFLDSPRRILHYL